MTPEHRLVQEEGKTSSMSEHSGDEAMIARVEAGRLTKIEVPGDKAWVEVLASDLKRLTTLSRRIITPDEAVVEAVARAMAGDDWDVAFTDRSAQRICQAQDGSFRDINLPSRDDYRDQARRALSALRGHHG